MTKTQSPGIPQGDGVRYTHKIKSMSFADVLINGQFKMVVFFHLDGENYIVIGDTTPYYRAMFLNGDTTWEVAIENEQWYSVAKDEGNNIYRKIKASEKISKKGNYYYRWTD